MSNTKNPIIDYLEDDYEEDIFDDYEEEEEDEEEEENEADNVDVEVEEEVDDEEENVEDDVIDEPEEEINEDDSGIGIEEIIEEKVVNARKREFNIDREKIRKQISSFKFFNSENINTELKPIVQEFTTSEKNINIFLNNITSKEDKLTMLNVIRFMYYKDLSLKDILTAIKDNSYSFNNILWDKQREEIKKEVIRLQTKIEVIESYIECPRCKQKKIQFYNVQLRRADEPPTTFNNCMNKDCMYTWRTG
jgi:DNA-directed RNA polymerase subunit M/transcription elongation factor TFIIS